MTLDLIERLAAFDAYVEELKAHSWTTAPEDISRKWSTNQANHKKLQETMKADTSEGRYFMRAYWTFTNWAYQHHDDFERDQIVQGIRNELAIEATTQLITPEE